MIIFAKWVLFIEEARFSIKSLTFPIKSVFQISSGIDPYLSLWVLGAIKRER